MLLLNQRREEYQIAVPISSFDEFATRKSGDAGFPCQGEAWHYALYGVKTKSEDAESNHGKQIVQERGCLLRMCRDGAKPRPVRFI